MTPVFLISFVLAFLTFWLLGGREFIGEWLLSLFPKDYLQVGDKAQVYLNGKYNRAATITKVTDASLVIYDKIPLAIDYRGRFYATGIDNNDGSKLLYLKTRKHYKFVRAAELIKKAFNVQDEAENLIPSDEGLAKSDNETETEADHES